VLGEELR